MFSERVISALALLAKTNYHSLLSDDFDPPELSCVKGMFYGDTIVEVDDAFEIHRETQEGTRCILRMPKSEIGIGGYLRLTYTYSSCNALDRVFGFADTKHDYGGLNIVDFCDKAKLAVRYLPVKLELPSDEAAPVVATIAKPSVDTVFLTWFGSHERIDPAELQQQAAANGFTLTPVIEEAINSLFCAITANGGADTKALLAAGEEYWDNKIQSISYTPVWSYG